LFTGDHSGKIGKYMFDLSLDIDLGILHNWYSFDVHL